MGGYSTNGATWIVSRRFDVWADSRPSPAGGPPGAIGSNSASRRCAALGLARLPSSVSMWRTSTRRSIARTWTQTSSPAVAPTTRSQPLVCLAVGVVLHSLGALVFWRVLAYAAVFHFVRQQFGFVMLYRHRCGERSLADRRLDKMAIYSTMLYPLAFWHATSDRRFEWFVEGDFLSLPAWMSPVALWIYSAILLVFLVRQAPDLPGTRYGQLGQDWDRNSRPRACGTRGLCCSTQTSPSRLQT